MGAEHQRRKQRFEEAGHKRGQDPDLVTAAIFHGYINVQHIAAAQQASQPHQQLCHWRALAGPAQPLAQ